MTAVAVALNNAHWAPDTEGEKQLKEALENVLISSPSSVVTTAPDGKKNRFILQTQGYHGRCPVSHQVSHCSWV
jgi:hypothetical protein